ncbi:MAG: hypothetical protein ACTSXP_08110, partial [Promethearchaeota archaeon]
MKIYMINKGELQEIDKLIFSSGDSYIVDDGSKIWLWHGKNASVDEKETAAVTAKKLDDERGGRAKIITVEQGEFSADARRFKAFCSEHGGLKVMDKNLAESFLVHYEKEKIPPSLFKVSSEEFEGINSIEYVQVDLKKENLDSDDVMLLFVPNEDKTYIWVGKGANVKEKVRGGQIARQFDKDLPGVQQEIFIDEGEEPD